MKKFSKVTSIFLVLALCLSTLVVSVGAVTNRKNYILKLNANKSKGYSLFCTVNNKNVVSLSVKKKNVSKTTSQYIFTFSGKKKGSAVATLKYGTKKKTISQKTINLTIDENKNIGQYTSPKNLVVKLDTKAMTNYNYSYHCTDNSIATVKPNLKFKDKGATYIFTFKGKKQGKATYTIKYKITDKKSTTKVVKISVDKNLNVTLAK